MLAASAACLVLLAAPAAGMFAASAAAAAAEEARAATVGWGPIAAPALPGDLSRSLQGLLAASLESTGTIRAVPDPAAADLSLVIEVKGRGPWSLRAQGVVRAAPGGKPRKVSARKVTFADRAGLATAVDALAADLCARWLGEGGTGPAPLSAALSASDEAVDSYLAALEALHGTDVPAARSGLDDALARDPGFALAAVESAYLSIAEGNHAAALAALRAAGRVRGPGSPLAAKAWGGMSTLLDVEYVMSGRGLVLVPGGPTKWDAVLAGLAGLARAEGSGFAGALRRAAEFDPGDPRTQHFLGIALMKDGEFSQAAEAFGRAVDAWPSSAGSRVLKAESHARARQTDAARETLEAMKAWMADNGMKPAGDASNPSLMLGSVELLEGHYDAALDLFETALEAQLAEVAPMAATATLYRTVAQMRRDVIVSPDPLERDRQMEKARAALARYEEALSPEQRRERANELLMLRGLIDARAGDTVEAWKIVERMTGEEGEDEPVFEKEWLAGSIMLKEGDISGAVEKFAKVSALQGHVEDWIVLGQLQIQTRQYDEAAASLANAGQWLQTWRAPWPPALDAGDLVLTDPYRAAMVPTYYYHRARLAYLTGDPETSRRHFNMMLGYYKQADSRVHGMVSEAWGRGATPE